MDIEIAHADCREVMSRMTPGSVQLVVTSPPYNAGKEYESTSTVDEYREWARNWVGWIPSLLNRTGSFWLNVGYMKVGQHQTLPLTYLYYPLIDLPLIQEVVWHYEGGMAYKSRFSHRTERWMWFVHDEQSYQFDLDAIRDARLNRTSDRRNNPLGKNPTDYWYFDRVVSGTGKVAEKTIHPCQFPEAMIERIILACSQEGDLILDPFGGSGTVAVVCQRLQRRCLLIEQDEKYVEAIRNRLGRGQSRNDDLFVI